MPIAARIPVSPFPPMPQKILILGVGNILLKDEGFGVHVVNRLEKEYSFSENIRLIDGGTLGIRLLPEIQKAGLLIAVDIMTEGNPPGTIKRFSGFELASRIVSKNSLHQVSFMETLGLARMENFLPETVVFAAEALDTSPWGTEPTPAVAEKIPAAMELVLAEITRARGLFVRKNHGNAQ
jgi:hydrogenase maturation protease